MTSRVCLPMEPVEPRMATRVSEDVTTLSSIQRYQAWFCYFMGRCLGNHPAQVVVHQRGGEEEAVQPVCDAAVAGHQTAGVLDPQPTLQGRLNQVSDHDDGRQQ